MKNLTVLIVEDHPGVRDSIERMVEQWPDVDIHSAENFVSAAIWINTIERLDLLLCDVCLPGPMNGVDVADVATSSHSAVAVVMFSADSRADIGGMHDSYAFIQKPFNREELTVHIDRAFSKLHASAKLAAKSVD